MPDLPRFLPVPRSAPKPLPLWLALLRFIGCWLLTLRFSGICLLLVACGIDAAVNGSWGQAAIALRRAANAAVQQTVTELNRAGDEQATQLATVIGKALKEPMPEAPLAGHATLLQALQAGIAERLAVLDADAGHSFADPQEPRAATRR